MVNLTLVALKAECCSRARAGVVDRLFAKVISGKHVSPKLNQELNHLQIVCFSSVMKRRLMNLCSVYIRTFKKKRDKIKK